MNKTRKWAMLAASAIAIGMVAFLVGRAWAGGIPAAGALTYSGVLQDAAGTPLTGDHPIEVKLWNAATPGTTPLCQTQSTQTLSAGRFSTALPDPCTDAIKGNVDVWVEVAVDGVSLGTTKLGAVPYAVEAGHAVNADRVQSASAEPAACDSTAAGLVYFDASVKQFRGCTGTAWTSLSNAVPTVFAAAVSADVHPPNTDGSCTISANSPWTGVPGMEQALTLERDTNVRVVLSGSMTDRGPRTDGLHCALRYLIDGSPAPGAQADFGHVLWSTNTWLWSSLGSEKRFALSAGSHTISVEARSGLCSAPSGYDPDLCFIEASRTGAVADSATRLTLHVEVP